MNQNRKVLISCCAADRQQATKFQQALSDLEDAIVEAETDTKWDGKTVWFRGRPVSIEIARSLRRKLRRVLQPRGRIYHGLECYVPSQIGNRDLPWIEVRFADLPPGMRRCRASGGCSG
jgi:hypothetical protein